MGNLEVWPFWKARVKVQRWNEQVWERGGDGGERDEEDGGSRRFFVDAVPKAEHISPCSRAPAPHTHKRTTYLGAAIEMASDKNNGRIIIIYVECSARPLASAVENSRRTRAVAVVA